jgi:hypothetical protein
VLPVKISSAEREVLLQPHDLSTDAKAGGFKSCRYLRRVKAGVPDIGNIPGK